MAPRPVSPSPFPPVRTILNPSLKPYPGPEDETSPPIEPTDNDDNASHFLSRSSSPNIWSRYHHNNFPPHGDPGTIGITTVESRLADDVSYRAHQSSFLASHRTTSTTPGPGPKSLESLATSKVVESLRYDPEGGLKTLRKSPEILQELVLDRLHYVSFRGLQTLVNPSEDDLIAKEASLDLETWVIKSELMMRQDPASMAGLVTLDDNLDIVFPDSTVHGGYRELRRRDPPKSNFCFFDQMKPATVRVQNTTEGYVKTFHESTAGILDGLDWGNVFVAGGIALNTLLRVDGEEEEKVKSWVSADRDSDIDVYIYGIKNPREANKKVKHIYEIWSKNVDAAAAASGKKMPEKLLIKNSKTINFLSDYPHRRIQVILKLNASPTDVLLNFDLDPCAIGFNGKEVLMLPRCCRALETGYSVFTTDLVEGHHLGDRRETQLPRVYKYADRGFGIRILPQYLCALAAQELRWRAMPWSRKPVVTLKPREPPVDETPEETEKRMIISGKKFLCMIACYEDDLVHRVWIGPTARSKYQEDEEYVDTSDDEDYRSNGDPIEPFDVHLGHFDGRHQYGGKNPHGKSGLGGLKLFYRHASLWVKEKEGKLTIKRNSFISPTYEPEGYSDLPGYEWNDGFKVKAYAKEIDDYNRHVYQLLSRNIDNIWAHRNQTLDGYFTRRTERLCYGSDIDALLERELAIPVYIPKNFEDYANRIVKEALRAQGIVEPSGDDFELLIPVHEEGMGRGLVQERPRGEHNWAFWLISPSVSWARLDRRIDEIFEVLWTFYNISVVDYSSSIYGANDGHYAWATLLKHHLDRRSPRLLPRDEASAEKPDEKKTFIWPDEREQKLFIKWVKDEPRGLDWDMAGYQCDLGHRKYHDEDGDYQPDENDYWRKDYEDGSLEEWLAWGSCMPDQTKEEEGVDDVEGRGEKRKRMSIGSQAPPAKKVVGEGEDEED